LIIFLKLNSEQINKKASQRTSLNFSSENFVYLKRKDIMLEYEFFERLGEGNLYYI